MSINKPVCRNGRRCGLKIRWWQHRVGSSPTTGTNRVFIKYYGHSIFLHINHFSIAAVFLFDSAIFLYVFSLNFFALS